ncbi:MAG TPA: hypothetical protein VGF13_15565 [Verrucomicrobiae bacterium]|jgi:hypothetical protein
MKTPLIARRACAAVVGLTLVSSEAVAQSPRQLNDDARYEQPGLLTGTIYEARSGTNKVLFTSKRTATRSNSTVFVTCDYFYANGAVAAREQIVFERGQLVWFQLDEKQTGARGSATIARDGKNAGKQKILFDWATTESGMTTLKTDSEAFQSETLVGDMIPYFIATHWNELARGEQLSFRFIVSDRLETVGFKLTKESDVTWRGNAALRLRMEPSSVVIRRLVDPLFFIVEKATAHRIFEYVGRVTPMMREGSKWKDLDARTVYDW